MTLLVVQRDPAEGDNPEHVLRVCSDGTKLGKKVWDKSTTSRFVPQTNSRTKWSKGLYPLFVISFRLG